MLNRLHPWELGATLYTPATHSGLKEVFSGHRLTEARSVVVCLEDAVREHEVAFGLENLATAARVPQPSTDRPHLFVRVRHPEMVERVVQLVPWGAIQGLVLPKATAQNLHDYMKAIPADCPWLVMPTLETAEVFDPADVRLLRAELRLIQDRVLMLRIGGNDLLHQLGMRRPKSSTIYATPLDTVICRLVQMFKPEGFHLSAPVFEHIDRMDLLEEEVRQDLAHGLTGKTVIHPSQIPIVEPFYAVSQHDSESAAAILDPASPAVFHLHGSMCEPATHSRWAQQIAERRRVFGVGSVF